MNINTIIWALIFSSSVFAQELVIYTIEGKKDPRLQAKYVVSYVSTGTSEECKTRKGSIGTKSNDPDNIDTYLYIT
jgi:hypothetical protein